MQKRFVTIFLLLTGYCSWGQDLKTGIEAVTVFQNGAQVTRTGSTALTPGTHEIHVRNISPLLRKESIQVKGEGDFTILSVNYQTNLTEEKIDKVRVNELEVKKRELENRIQDLEAQVNVMSNEEQMINSLQQISTQQYPNIVEMVVKATTVIQEKLSDLKSRQIKVNRQLNESRDQLQLTTQELTAKRIPKTTSSNEILIKVNAKKETKADFSIAYVVNNARWYPTYDLRVNSVAEPLRIEYKANISQQTGEDWSNVKLRLSTTDPNLSGQRPKLEKWNLFLNQSYQQPQQQNNYQRYTGAAQTRVSGRVTDEYGEVLPFANIMAVGSTVGTSTDLDGNYNLNLPQGITQITVSYIGYETATLNVYGETMNIVLKENTVQLEEVQIVSEKDEIRSVDVQTMRSSNSMVTISGRDIQKMPGVRGARSSENRSKKFNASASVPLQVVRVENIVSTEFVIDEKYAIPSDTKFYTVNISNLDAAAFYQYYCAPKLDKDVFLTAQLTNWDTYNLLEGQANVFFEGTYVGSTLMDVHYLSDTLNISLGRDKSVVVDRKKSKEMSRRKVFGNETVAYRDWDIQVRNNKQQKINLMLEDQFPVSADSRIEVKKEERSGAKLDELTGIVTWILDVDTKENKSVKLKYSVKFPSNAMVGLD